MRRPLLVLVLLATIAVGWAQAAFASVHGPSSSSQTDHVSRLQKLARRVVAYARHQVGVAYSWGGTSPRTGFDCSGLVYAAYRSIGWKIPRSSWDQLRVGRPVGFRAAAARRPALHPGRRPRPARRLETRRDLGPANGRARSLRAARAAPAGVRGGPPAAEVALSRRSAGAISEGGETLWRCW